MPDFSAAHAAMRRNGVSSDPATLAGWRMVCALALGKPAPLPLGEVERKPMPGALAMMLRHPVNPGWPPLYR